MAVLAISKLPVRRGVAARDEAVALRGHHYLCLLGYSGAAYTPAFGRHFEGLIDRINVALRVDGFARLAVVRGRDAVCDPMCPGRFCNSLRVLPIRDARVLRYLTRLITTHGAEDCLPQGLPVRVGTEVQLDRPLLALMREVFHDGSIRRGVCGGCPHERRCTEGAARGFVGAKLELG